MSRREFKDYKRNTEIISILPIKEVIEDLQFRIFVEKRAMKSFQRLRELHKNNRDLNYYYQYHIQLCEE